MTSRARHWPENKWLWAAVVIAGVGLLRGLDTPQPSDVLSDGSDRRIVLPARVSADELGLTLTNPSATDWRFVEMTIRSGTGPAYRRTMERVGANTTVRVPLTTFTTADGERFNGMAQAVRQFTLEARAGDVGGSYAATLR